MWNLSLEMKSSFSRISSEFFCSTIFYSLLISNFKRAGFFCFLNWFFRVFLLNWFKNLKAQFGLNQKGQDPGPLDSPPRCAPVFTAWAWFNIIFFNSFRFCLFVCCSRIWSVVELEFCHQLSASCKSCFL